MNDIQVKLKALCDENRLKILKLLAQRELCACDFLENLDLSQPTVSHHLKVLVESGLLRSEKRGKWHFYRINYDAVKELLGHIDEIVSIKCENVKLCDTDCGGQRQQ
jgi:ArsR family transcriptional regulator